MSLSREDTLRIVKHFLLNSPPGEFEDVLSDIREIIADDDLLNQGAFDIFHAYNIEQLIPVDVPGQSYKIILCKYSEIDDTHYFDPHGNNVVQVDHTRGVVSGVEKRDEEESAVSKQRRTALQAALDKYVQDHYLNGLCTVYPAQGDAQNKEFIVCVTASKFNEKNFWSGRWRSVFRVVYDDDKSAKVSGSMKVNVHYYESGNVQLNTSREHGESISGADIAAEVVKVIRKAEGAFQTEIDNSCANLSESFKSLRRRLPITGTLFDFGSGAHKMAQSFGGK